MKISSSATETRLISTLFEGAQSAVRALVNSAALDAASATGFGARVSGASVAAVVDGFERDGWPSVVVIGGDVLHGARGAYDAASNTIYLSRDFVFAFHDAPAAIRDVLVEEIGHAIDSRVNTDDAPGDEGAIFADLVGGHALDASQLAGLRAENDHGTITVDGKSAAVEFAAPVVGTVTLDGSLADWSAGDQIDKTLSTTGYDIYAKVTGNSYVFALKAPVAIGADTTAWLNTDQKAATGFQIFGSTGGAEFNVNFDAAGTPHLFRGDAGQTLVSGATVSFGYSADHKVVEFAVAKSAIGSPQAINTLWDVNDSTFLSSDYASVQYEVVDNSSLPARTDFTKKVGIVYSDTSANQYFDKMAYSQLFMAAQNQAAMAGVHYDVLTESDLTNISKLSNYDALLFPGFANVKASQVASIEHTLKLAVEQYHVGIITAGEFMVYDAAGNALPGDPYSRMKTLLDVQLVNGGFPANVAINASDITHPVMQDYASHELIHSYTGAGWLAFEPVTTAGTSVLATQTVGSQTYDAVVATTTGGRNVHFSTDEVMGDNNLLWQAIDYSVNGSGVTAGLQLSRQASIVASRTDMDQAQEMADVTPENGGPGIYDKLLPILQQWKTAYNFVGSYYIDIGNKPAQDQATDWVKSGAYYKQLLAMGNELGSHSTSHPENTNTLTPAQIQTEFQGSKQIIEQHMSQVLGQPFTVVGAAVPGASENLPTALSIIQYYNYLSGGFASVGSGYPGANGYLNPAMAALDKVYLAPNVEFDFSLVEFKNMTAAQATAEWQREWNVLTAHSDVPVLVWPWHDYGAADWATNPPADSPYTTQMFTDFISRAYASGAEFVTLADLADRISAFNDSTIKTTVSGSTVTATVTSPDAGRFALDLDNLGTQKIANVTGWYAYDADSVFLPRNGGSYTIHLGTAADDVTHITALPMRAELVSLSGNGTNLNFSVIGEGKVIIDLINPAGKQLTVTGAAITSLAGDKLTLDLGAIGQHNVSVSLGAAVNHAPTLTSDGGGATAAISLAENTTAVTTVHATDVDAGQALAYSIAGGADAARFSINAQSGALSFVSAPDFEAPADQGANNVYDVIVGARDSAGATDTQAIAVTVRNLAGPTLTGDDLANTLNGSPEEDSLWGRGGNDTLNGANGNDFINGGAGADRMSGGAGDDNYFVDHIGDRTIEAAGAGTDTVQTTLAAYTLEANVEFLIYAGSGNFDGTGNALQNILTGGAGKDTLRGGGEHDFLNGRAGNDVLIGGAGADTLTGGAGSDRFDYNAITEGSDTITDFTTGTGGDQLDVKDVLVGYQPGTSNISNFVHLTGTGSTVVSVNADGAGSDFVALATLQGVANSANLLNDLIAHGNLIVS